MIRSLIFATLALASAEDFVPEADLLPTPVAQTRVCLDAAQTRLAITEHKLANPVVAQKAAANHAGGGEFLRSKLCRWNDDYVYEISLLSREGRVTRVFIHAQDGRVVNKNAD